MSKGRTHVHQQWRQRHLTDLLGQHRDRILLWIEVHHCQTGWIVELLPEHREQSSKSGRMHCERSEQQSNAACSSCAPMLTVAAARSDQLTPPALSCLSLSLSPAPLIARA